MRIQGRRHEDGTVQYIATVGAGSMPGRQQNTGRLRKKPHIQLYSDVLWNHDRQREKRRELRVDAENDYYRQEWFDLATGESVWVKEGRLNDFDMHGQSARRQE